MRDPIAQKIDRCSIERANNYALTSIEWATKMAEGYQEDPDRKQRLDASECFSCYRPYGGGRQGTDTGKFLCGICNQPTFVTSPRADVLCLKCAKENQLCKHCGADVDLKSRRKSRPYEDARMAP